MTNRRADLGFGSELDSFDPGEWEPKPKPKQLHQKVQKEAKAAAEASGFKSREPENATAKPKQRRRITGRNQQFNIKAKAETIEAFYKVADANEWGLGETLEHAVELLKDRYLRGHGGP